MSVCVCLYKHIYFAYLSTNGNSASFMSFSSEKSAKTFVLVFLIAAHIHTHTQSASFKNKIPITWHLVCVSMHPFTHRTSLIRGMKKSSLIIWYLYPNSCIIKIIFLIFCCTSSFSLFSMKVSFRKILCKNGNTSSLSLHYDVRASLSFWITSCGSQNCWNGGVNIPTRPVWYHKWSFVILEVLQW